MTPDYAKFDHVVHLMNMFSLGCILALTAILIFSKRGWRTKLLVAACVGIVIACEVATWLFESWIGGRHGS